ncbi:MAG: DUF4199 domain-containing protein [Chloroflexia bacterium]|nr:DUF4199 domain-containing protein [Chloroflexia bacterium]
MKKIVLIFGIIAGMIVSAMLFISMATQSVDFENGELLGYATMIIALSTIFFGIKTYRDKHLDGSIKFGKAFLMGLYITLIASAMYTVSWMIILNTSAENFMEDYYQHSVEQLKQSGQTQAEIDLQIQQMEEFKELYKNPIVHIGVTFLEIFPVGLLISIISAAILRKRKIILVES